MPEGSNLYGYVGNDGVNYWDEYGLGMCDVSEYLYPVSLTSGIGAGVSAMYGNVPFTIGFGIVAIGSGLGGFILDAICAFKAGEDIGGSIPWSPEERLWKQPKKK